MARIQSTSQRAALRRRSNLGSGAHAASCSCLRGASGRGERSTQGHQVPHLRPLAGQGGGSIGEKQPLICCLRDSSLAHCEQRHLPGKGSA